MIKGKTMPSSTSCWGHKIRKNFVKVYDALAYYNVKTNPEESELSLFSSVRQSNQRSEINCKVSQFEDFIQGGR